MDELTLPYLSQTLDASTDHLVEHILYFEPEQFNRQPSSQSWSAAQLSEHILTLDQFILDILKGETLPLNRPANEKANSIETAMNNTGKSYRAPEPILPTGKIKDQQIIVTKIITLRKNMLRLMQSEPMDRLCLHFEHKSFGSLTRMEWIIFLVAHTRHHFQQYENLKQYIQNS